LIKKGLPSGSQPPITCEFPAESGTTVLLSSLGMGEGEETLSKILLKAFLKTLLETKQKPERIICYNQGVFLALEGSEVLEDLQALEKAGVKILVCGTCLDYYRVKERLMVGEISNMYDIAESLLSSRVIKP
jgi:selenium metabolism protein YedF